MSRLLHGRPRACSPERAWSRVAWRVGMAALVGAFGLAAGARAQTAAPRTNADAVLAVLARAALAEQQADLLRPRLPAVSGQIAFTPVLTAGSGPVVGAGAGPLDFTPVLTAGSGPVVGAGAGPLDFTSSSRLTLDYGRAKLNLGLVKPTTFGRAGQPDRFYSAELLVGRQALRVGDLTPRFTDHTTGYARVHGAEAQLGFGRWAQLNALHGLSQRATPTEGFLLGTFRRSFTGARLALTPWRPLALAVSAVRLADEAGSADLSASPLAPTAGENLLVGSDLTVHFLRRRRGQLYLEYAASVYTDDLAAPDTLGRLRGEDLSPADLARTGLVRALVTVNDSTRVGHALTAKLVLPAGPGRTTLEFRRTSRLYATLAQPWAPTGQDRYRLQTTLPLFARAVQVMANAEYSRTAPGRLQPFGMDALNAYASVAFTTTPVGRVTVGLRGNRRENHAPAPEPNRPDRRMRATMLAPSLAIGRDVRLGVPLSLTLTLSGTTYADAFRPANAYRTVGAQLAGQTAAEARLQLNAQARYALTTREATGATHTSAEVLLREGYDLRLRRLHVFLVNGLGLDLSSDDTQRTNLFTYGAGARWTPADGTGLEAEWLSRQSVNHLFDDYSYDQHTLELRLTHRL